MSKRLLVGLAMLSLSVVLVSPASALAASGRLASGIRGVQTFNVIRGVGNSVRIAGRLVVRKRVRRSGRWETVDAPCDGGVYLRLDSGRGLKVGWTRARHGVFSFTVSKGGHYGLVHPATGKTKRSERTFIVSADVLSLGAPSIVDAAQDASGDVTVDLRADFGAPSSVVGTGSGNGIAAISVTYPDPEGGVFPLEVDSLWSLEGTSPVRLPFYWQDPLGVIDPLPGYSVQDLLADSICFVDRFTELGERRYRFVAPADEAKEAFTIQVGFGTSGDVVEIVRRELTVTPAALVATATP